MFELNTIVVNANYRGEFRVVALTDSNIRDGYDLRVEPTTAKVPGFGAFPAIASEWKAKA